MPLLGQLEPEGQKLMCVGGECGLGENVRIVSVVKGSLLLIRKKSLTMKMQL